MPDNLDNPFDPFADAVEAALAGFRDELRAFRAEGEKLREEWRSAPVIQPPVPVDVEAIRASVITEMRAELARAVAEIPAPKDGVDGKNGEPGPAGESIVGPPGPVGPAGIPGEQGERGADGIATREELDEMIEKRFGDLTVRTFADIYEGVYKRETDYQRGRFVTWGGNLWLSKADTRSLPGESPDWQLTVKKGKDSSNR